MTTELPDAAVDSTRSHRALAHPMRHRLLIALRGEPATISQLARRLEVRKGSVAHHLNVLVEAGMVRQAQTKLVRGGIEQYYEPAVDKILTREDDAPTTSALLAAVATEITTSPDPLLHLRHVRLSAEQASDLRATLEAILADPPAPGPDDRMYGILVGMYQRR